MSLPKSTKQPTEMRPNRGSNAKPPQPINRNRETKTRSAIKFTRVPQTPEKKAFTASIRERDGLACRRCGQTRYLEVHHVLTTGAHPEYEFTPENCVTLCEGCHRLDGSSAHNEPQAFIDWLLEDSAEFKAWIITAARIDKTQIIRMEAGQ